jgi:putative transposase
VSAYPFIAANQACFSVNRMCRLLNVSRSGFYDWLTRPISEREKADIALTEKIESIHEESRATYGAPRVHAMLRRQGINVGKKRVARLMRSQGLTGTFRKRRGRTTIQVPGIRTAPDLVQRDFFAATEPNKLWVADMTYIRTWEGWLYLASVMDTFSRKIVGWSMGNSMEAQLVVDALEMAIARRGPEAGLIHHSDRGAQYVALIFTASCKEAGIETSMGKKGCAYDNSAAESFFASLKKDLIHRRSWPTREDARRAVFDYIEVFYNRQRLHTSLGDVSPEEFEIIHHNRSEEDRVMSFEIVR